VPELSRLAPILLLLAGAAVPPASTHAAGAEPELLPVHPTAPANNTVITAEKDPLKVTLAWSIPHEPVPVRFFVEVVAIGQHGPHEIFATYVDQPSVDVALAPAATDYAWRVYTVGRHVAAYALSEWEQFSLQTAK
jgi:hypothetical protein